MLGWKITFSSLASTDSRKLSKKQHKDKDQIHNATKNMGSEASNQNASVKCIRTSGRLKTVLVYSLRQVKGLLRNSRPLT